MENKIDVELNCKNCQNKFIWTIGEQSFMEQLKENGKLDKRDKDTGDVIIGEVVPPKRCPNCRLEKKNKYNEKIGFTPKVFY